MSEFFNVITKKQSYLNIVYMLLSFPLAITYFVFAVTALSLGVGLIPIFIGIPVLMLTLLSCRKLMHFECVIAEGMINLDKAATETWKSPRIWTNPDRVLSRAKDIFFDPENWKAVVYIFIKFVYSTIAFVMIVTFLSVSAALVCAPFIYQALAPYVDMTINGYSLLQYLGYDVTMFQESIVYMFIGLLLSVLSFHMINLLAFISNRFLYVISYKPENRMGNQGLHAVK